MNQVYFLINAIRRGSKLDLGIEQQDTIYTLTAYGRNGTQHICLQTDSLDRVIQWLTTEYNILTVS